MSKNGNEHLESLIGSLYHQCSPSLFSRFKGSTLPPNLLEKINEINDLNSLYLFIPLMFVKHKTIRMLAKEKISQLLNTIPLSQLNKVDEHLRKSHFARPYTEAAKYWHHLEPSIIDTQSVNDIICLKILCCHPNGYIRYKAIITLAKRSISEAIPFLIIRLNDWVEEIKSACLNILEDIANSKFICHFIECLSLLSQLKNKERYNQINFIKNIEKRLITQCSEGLFDKINSPERICARYAFTLLTNSDSPAMLEQLLTTTINHKDIIIKLNAFNLAVNYYDLNNLLIFIKKTKDDKLIPIRKKTLYAFIKYFPQHSRKVLEYALFDPSSSIRAMSRYYLKQQGINEFSDYYKDALIRQDKKIKPVILGLSESGKQHDFHLLRPFLTKHHTNLNTVLLKATFKLQPQDWKNVIHELLANPNSALLKSFVRASLENSEGYSLEEIIDLIYKRNSLMHIRALVTIFSNGIYERWKVLNFVLQELELLTDQDCKVIFEGYLLRWIANNSPNKVFVRPSVDRAELCLKHANNLLNKYPDSLLYNKLVENITCFIN